MPIPAEHRKIAIEQFGYELDGEMSESYEETYDKHQSQCLELGLALGYRDFTMDVEGIRILATHPETGERVVLADLEDPMNLWAHAWSRIHVNNLPQPPTPGPLRRLIQWLSGEKE